MTGWFVYEGGNGGWTDRFTIEDADGMPFVLDDLKQFHGRPVRITIEETDLLPLDFGPTAHVYERLGLTAKNIRVLRNAERAELENPTK